MKTTKLKALITLSKVIGGLKAQDLIARKDLATSVKQVFMADIKMSSKDGVRKASLSVVKQGENVFIRDSKVETTLVSTDYAKQSYEDFCMDYLTVTADMKTWESLNRRSLFINHEAGAVYTETTKKKSKKNGEMVEALRNLKTGKLVLKATANVVEYKFFISTAGLLKDGSAIFYRAESAVSANAILEKNIPGIISNLPESMRQDASVKFAARPGLAWTKGVEVAHFNNVIKVEGNFDNADFNGKERNTGDGAILMRASAAANMLNLSSQSEAVGMILQARFFGIYKFQVIVIADPLFKSHVELYKNERDITVYGDEAEADFIMDNNAQKAVMDVSNGFTLTLMSVGKLTTGRLNKQIVESLLVAGAETGRLEEVTKFLEDSGTEQIAGYVSRALDTDESELKMFKNTNAKGDKVAPYALDVINTLKPANPIASRIRLDDSISTMSKVIDKMGIELYCIDGSSQIYNAVVSTDIAAFIGKSVIPTGKIVVGKVTKKLSEIKKVYGNKSSEYLSYKKEFGTATMFKMPKMYYNEFYQADVLDLEELADLIENSDVPDSMKRHYEFYFANMSDATIMFPADRSVFELLAGMDIDFDKVVVVFNQYINELLNGRQENLFISSTVAEDKKKSKKVMSAFERALSKKDSSIIIDEDTPREFNTKEEGFFYDVFMVQLVGEGQIGVITFYNNKVLAILLEVLSGNDAQAKHFLKECVQSTKGIEREYKVDRNIIDPLYVDMMIAEIKEVEWSLSNIALFLSDCSRAFRLYQETAIDAGKTGIYLVAKLTVRTVIADSLLAVSVEYVANEEELEDGKVKVSKVPTIKRAEYKEKEVKFFEKQADGRFVETRDPMTTINLSDVMGRIQDKFIKTVNVEAMDVYEKNSAKLAYTDKETNQMKDELESALSTKAGAVMVNKLYMIKDLYHDAFSRYMESLNSLDFRSDSYESEVEALKDANRKQEDALANSARKVIANYNSSEFEIGALALAIGCSGKKEKAVKSGSRSRFAYKVLPEYTTAFIVGGSDIEMSGSIIKNVNPACDSIELEFVNGVAIDGSVILKERFTGIAEIISNEVVASLNMFNEVKTRQEESMLVLPLKGNEFVISEMTRDSVVAIDKTGFGFYKDENASFEKMTKHIFFDDSLVKGNEYYINDSYEASMWVKKSVAGREVSEEIECIVLSVQTV